MLASDRYVDIEQAVFLLECLIQEKDDSLKDKAILGLFISFVLFLVSILQTAHLWANTGVVFRELSFSRLECGVHDRLHIYPLCGIFYFPWHRHQIEGTNGFYCLIRKTERFTISNVESQVFTPNNSRLDPGSNPGCPRDKRMSYHWTNCASAPLCYPLTQVRADARGGTVTRVLSCL